MKGRTVATRFSPRVDEKAFEAASAELAAILAEGDPDVSWAEDLPEAPELPREGEETVAMLIPKRG